MNRAVFLDRDGTILEHVPYMTDPTQVHPAPGVTAALQRLRDAGFLLVVTSNQSMIGRGIGSMEQAEAVSRRMVELFAEDGVQFDAVKYCFDAPSAPTDRRKPNPGMLLEAAEELTIDLPRSAMIGDDIRDPQAGRAAGCGMNLLISPKDVHGEEVVPSFKDAVERVVDWR